MQIRPLHLTLIAACLVAAPASASSPFLGRELAIDQAGNALVNFGAAGAFEPVVAVVDPDGNVLHCRPDAPMTDVRARLDAPGFLALRFEFGHFPDSHHLERWDGRGTVEWSYRTAGDDFAPAPDGGAVVWEVEYGSGRAQSKLARLDARGTILWRENVFADGSAPFGVDLRVDTFGRVLFAANPQSLFHVNGPRGTAHLGLVNADGSLAWIQREARFSLTETRILDDGAGDFWWFVGRSLLAPPVVDYRASKLERRTAWGLPLAAVDGPALVPGSEISEPQVDDRDVLWFLAEGPSRGDLVRLTREGRIQRHSLASRIHVRLHPLFGPTPYPTGLSVQSGSAWVAVSEPGVHDQLTAARYTESGLAWSRRIGGVERLRELVAAPAGDARLLATDGDDLGWLLSLDPRRGEVLWRKSMREVTAACNGL